MTDIFTGKVTLKVGASDVSNVNITNVKLLGWDKKHPITPQTVANTVNPVGWHKGHKHVEGELHVLSEAVDAMRKQGVDYIPDDAVNPAVPYFVATVTDNDGGVWTATATGAIMGEVKQTYKDGEDTIIVYSFKAYKIVVTGPV